MSDYPSWSEERDAYADAKWSAAPPAASHYGGGGGGGGGYPGADAYSAAPDAYSRGAAGGYAQYENRGSAGYGSAGYGSGGGGGGYGGGNTTAASSYVPKPGGPVQGKAASEISFDTSSRDPAHLRSRVFIGCLGQTLVVREDIIELCRPFGPLMAATLFKQGYAFVQFEQAEDADNACEVLNGKRWKGVNIDVHLAMEGLVRKTLPQKRGAEKSGGGGARGGGGGRGSMGGGGGGGGMGAGSMEGGGDWQGISSAKKAKLATAPLGSTTMNEEAMMEVNRANREAATADNSTPELFGSEMADTLICGTCRYVTSDFVAFREHRKGACVKPKESTEPPVLRCASCGLRFLSAWKMLFHLTDFHRMQLFKADYTEESIERAKYEDKKYQAVSDTRMAAWRAELANERAFVVEPAAAPAAAAPAAPSSNNNGSAAAAAAGRTGGGGGAAPAAPQQKQSFAEDDVDVNTFGAAPASKAAAPAAAAAVAAKSAAPVERVTTGADYDEDEEDDVDDGAPAPIPSLV